MRAPQAVSPSTPQRSRATRPSDSSSVSRRPSSRSISAGTPLQPGARQRGHHVRLTGEVAQAEPLDHEVQEVVLEDPVVLAVLPVADAHGRFKAEVVQGRLGCHAGTLPQPATWNSKMQHAAEDGIPKGASGVPLLCGVATSVGVTPCGAETSPHRKDDDMPRRLAAEHRSRSA